jgi:amidophosphoribosyltransferase
VTRAAIPANTRLVAEECGVAGVWMPPETASVEPARLAFFALYALQHRGQESAGLAAGDGVHVRVIKRMGLVGQAFAEQDLGELVGNVAMGHTRYSTTGGSRIENAQPMVVHDPALGSLAVGHNGNLINARELRDGLSARGVAFETSSDSEVLLKVIEHAPGSSWDERIANALPLLVGAWSLVFVSAHAVYAARDPLGVRPLVLGRRGPAWIVASETCALETIGATFVREVQPGEILRLDRGGATVIAERGGDRRALCVFEYVYLAAASSRMGGVSMYGARERMGEILADEHPVDADVVIPVPDSAIPSAIGYARRSGIEFREGLIKNRYIGRTFIQPSQELREHSVALKYNTLGEVLEGKRVVVVDDSIVRGSTSGPIVRLLQRAGATEVHMRICSPPIQHPCYFGVDMARRGELIASRKTVAEIREHIGADSLGYLLLEGLLRATGGTANDFCSACFTGDYPIPIQLELDKTSLEVDARRTPVRAG